MKKGKLIKSFQYAFSGIWTCIRYERNMKIHCGAAVFISLAGLYYHIEKHEWLILLLTIGGVMSLEMINTAVEKSVDLVTSEQHPLAKLAKDAAAGAVLLFSCIAVLIGGLIFLPYIL
ncbi:diacylglycerol kinase family protein [Ectobacillus panaciterrae]|uniref:diacylglycerol kinase family protein n=1 Tax=Ectobacillus panaciterrae TaxID=363872 RepID=UPI0004198F52|nr:diacylglycerol kinase family protein [Ectobacillus panaciterrae]